ncbi:hypothetical protein [Marinomonas epiphytica]
MNFKKRTLILTSIFLSLATINMNVNAEGVAIEWAPFVKVSGVTDDQLVTSANAVNDGFLINQKGFIKRELIKKNDDEYADVIYWKTQSDAAAAGEKVNTCAKCSDYFKLMDMQKVTGEGFAYYIIIKSWNR